MFPTISESAARSDTRTTLHVLFFGPVHAQLGVNGCDLECVREISTSTLWSRLIELHPALESWRPTVRLARNGEFLRDDEKLRPGDEIALIPPVSGG